MNVLDVLHILLSHGLDLDVVELVGVLDVLVAEEILQVLPIQSLQPSIGCKDHLIDDCWWAYALLVKV